MEDNKFTMEDFFGGLKDLRCIICGQHIPPERIKEFPKTKFCKTECTLKWLAQQEAKEDA